MNTTKIATLMTVTFMLALSPVWAADNAPNRLDRKIKVMEKVIDEVLVQSKNVYVMSRETTRGLKLDGYGALFIFDGSIGEALMRDEYSTHLENYFVPDVDREEDEDGGRRAPMVRADAETLEKRKAEREEKTKEHYAELKIELIDTLLDYGPTLTELDNNAWVTIVAFLNGESPFFGGSDQRLQIQIKMSDLRQHVSGNLSRDAAKKKMMITEQ